MSWHDRCWDFGLLRERILNAVDKRLHSPTRGCCDRHYWGWKSRDFPDLTLQYAMYPMALLLRHDHPAEQGILLGMLEFWLKNLTPHGSADQIFPGERSAGPTLYALHGVLSAREHLARIAPAATMRRLDQKARQGLDFSLREPEAYGQIANHKALYAHCFWLGYFLYEDPRYLTACRREIEEILASGREGWFPEYETADPGYQTQCLHYLTLLDAALPDAGLRGPILESLEEFCAWFVFPDRSYAGHFGGRGTELFYPYPFFHWARESPVCRDVVAFLFEAEQEPALVGWYALDFPNCIRLGTNYLLCDALRRDLAEVTLPSRLPCHRQAAKTWPLAGLAVESDQEKHLAVNLRRGGVFKAVDKKSLRCVDDTGYRARLGDVAFSSALFSRDADITMAPGRFAVTLRLQRVRDAGLTPWRLVVLRLLGHTLLHFGWFARWLKRRLVHMLILAKEPGPVVLRRVIEDVPGALRVTDTLTADSGQDLDCTLTSGDIPFHMACAGYHSEGMTAAAYAFTPRSGGGKALIETTIVFGAQNLVIERTQP